MKAALDADIITTDTWASLSDDESGLKAKQKQLQPYQITSQIMEQAKDDALFMHCLPAWRGKEVRAEVIDGQQSIIFDEAENRIHAQKAILLWAFGLEGL